MKTFFMNDYGEGAHPLVMRRLMETNMEHTCGYGLDEYSLRAADVIREKCGQPGAAVHIMTGGTSANSIAIAAFLRPYEAAICAPTGHINVHETGAVEATGHKVLPCAAKDGKVTAEGVEAVCALHTDEHMVAPRLLYVSQPTEIGTVYHLDELKALREVCDRLGLILFVDGARLGSALTSPECDMTLKDLAALADCFYIGGTKNGLLFGEAMVIVNPALQKDFRYMIKHNGGMIAKGRLGGVVRCADRLPRRNGGRDMRRMGGGCKAESRADHRQKPRQQRAHSIAEIRRDGLCGEGKWRDDAVFGRAGNHGGTIKRI